MIRKRIGLTEETDKAIKQLATRYGISYSGAVNMAVIKTKEETELYRQ